jgi:hypothetical protein
MLFMQARTDPHPSEGVHRYVLSLSNQVIYDGQFDLATSRHPKKKAKYGMHQYYLDHSAIE